MTCADLPEVLEIERACFGAPWSRQVFLEEVRNSGRSHPLILRQPNPQGGTRLLGYACLWCVHDELWINNLAVHRGFRRQGFGRRLLRAALDVGRHLGCSLALLEVRAGNEPAVRMYQGEGFRTIGVRPGYYTDSGENALVMAMRLRGQVPESDWPGGSKSE
ncbi:MAG: ribosomal protein S18-alanine N-acetyltransferase [Acidobacteriota bacterium]